MILLGPQFVLPRSERESCGSLVSFGQQQSQVCEKPNQKAIKILEAAYIRRDFNAFASIARCVMTQRDRNNRVF